MWQFDVDVCRLDCSTVPINITQWKWEKNESVREIIEHFSRNALFLVSLTHSIFIELLAKNSLLLCLQYCYNVMWALWLLLERENYRFMISCMCYTVGVYLAWHWSPMAIIAPAIATKILKQPRQVKKIENAGKQ